MSRKSAKKPKLVVKASINPRATAVTGAEVSFGIGVAASIVITSFLPTSAPYFAEIVATPIILGLSGGALGGYIYGLLEKHKLEKLKQTVVPVDESVSDIVHKLGNQAEIMTSLRVTEESSRPGLIVEKSVSLTVSTTDSTLFKKSPEEESSQHNLTQESKRKNKI